MPSYADEMASRLGSSQREGPVRILVSGRWTWDGARGEWAYDETDEREEAMEVDELLFGGAEGLEEAPEPAMDGKDGHAGMRVSGSSRANAKTFGQRLFQSLQARKRCHSVVVLDTNVLISSLAFFDALFNLLLQHRLSSLSSAPQGGASPSPMIIVVPYVVLVELDGLKKRVSPSSPSASSGQKQAKIPSGPLAQSRESGERAQEATRWILAALQRQRSSYVRFAGESATEGTESERPLGEGEWVLHVERREEARARKGDVWDMTPDEEILSLCSVLGSASAEDGGNTPGSTKPRPLDAFLFSDDVNARARAEAEGIRTLDLGAILGLKPGSRRTTVEDEERAAREMLEQWSVQLGNEMWTGPGTETWELVEPVWRPSKAAQGTPGGLQPSLPIPAATGTVEDEPMSLDDDYHGANAASAPAADRTSTSPALAPTSSSRRLEAALLAAAQGTCAGSAASVWAKAGSSPTRSRRRFERDSHFDGSEEAVASSSVTVSADVSESEALNPQLDIDFSDLPSAYPSRFPKRRSVVGDSDEGTTRGKGERSMWSREGSSQGRTARRW